jgi:hypothetical protein
MCAACWLVLLQVTIVNQLQGQRQQVTVVGDDAQVSPTSAAVAVTNQSNTLDHPSGTLFGCCYVQGVWQTAH